MKAWVLHNINKLKYEEIQTPAPKENEVLVAVKAAGICGSDIPRAYRDGAHQMPLVLGHEFSGEVVQIGENVEERWLHKRVGVFPLIPCRECIACKQEKYEMCRNYNYLGSRCNGAFAEYVTVPAANLIELPENVSYEEAAMLEPMAVAVHAMRQANVAETDTIAVYGLGTIGMLLVMFLLEKGIQNILVIGNKEFQKEMAVKLGIKESNFCNSRTEDVAKWIFMRTNGKGADVFFECVGKNEVYAQAVELTAPAGTVCLVGNPQSDMELEKKTYWKILRNQLTLIGTWNSSFTGKKEDDWHYVLQLLAEKRIHPAAFISHGFSMKELEQGFAIMRDKTEHSIKVMMASCEHLMSAGETPHESSENICMDT
uniref:galactitol-1-phosphate 5-dehydrogenase n=1 Tax=Agathobacter sp. TaxID=2021311 RepID=UPI004055EE8B